MFSAEVDPVWLMAGKTGRAPRSDDALRRYVEHAKASFRRGMSLEKTRVAVDMANGVTYKFGAMYAARASRELTVVHNMPNGRNINANCGSTHPEESQRIATSPAAAAQLAPAEIQPQLLGEGAAGEPGSIAADQVAGGD